MKRILAVLWCWLAACLVLQAQAQGPRMTVAGTQTILEIEQAEVDIRVAGGVARTEMELVFRNDTDRMVEGEFTLPLPEGATVSSYALEVNGALREAVAVEKERASRAYETIKRQMIDPGIVERQAGNVYRTRVFPVPANGTKRLRIGYVETLPRGADGYRYRVPLKFAGLLKEFRAEVAVPDDAGLKLTGTTPVSFAADGKGNRVAKANAVSLDGEMEITVPVPAGPELVVEGDFFVLRDVFPDLTEEKRPQARSITLCWDASESCARLDPAAIFGLLDEWFRAQGDVKVAVKLLRNDVEDAGVHEVRGGDWSAIRKLLESVDYDGATSLAGIESGDSDLVIYCGDGEATWGGRTTGLLKSPLFVLQRGGASISPALAERADATGGVVVRVGQEDHALALRKLQYLPLRITGVSGGGVRDFQVEPAFLLPGVPVRVSGRLAEGAGGSMEIAYGVGAEPRVKRQVAVPAALPQEGLLRRLWAQAALGEREKRGDRAAIIEHCRQHALVSDETSLIVLERFEDHLTYEIPPPEPDLRKRYDEVLAERRQRNGLDLATAWKSRVAWHRKEFPGLDYVLVPRIRQVGIWKKSIESVFQAEELDAKSFATITGWRDRALALIERRKTLPDAAAYQEWLGQIATLSEEGKTIRKTPVEPPPPGKSLVVSVRGLVAQPGQVKSDGKLTLRQAVAEAGGPMWDGLLGRVALYRSSGKTIYNTYSKRFEDIELRPGDMVVVENEPYAYGGADDPFVAMPTRDPVEEDPVVGEEEGRLAELAPAAGATPQALLKNHGLPLDSSGRVERGADPESGMPDLAPFEERLKSGGDPHLAYVEARAGKQQPGIFYSEVARRLFAAGHEALALRVISTLAERDRGRAAAFWLMEFGKPEAAARLYRDLPLPVETAATSAGADELLMATLSEDQSVEGLVIASAELNRLDPRAVPDMAEDLPCDIRITIQSDISTTPPLVEIIDPSGEPLGNHRIRLFRFGVDYSMDSPLWPTSRMGGRMISANGVVEYAIRRAAPGIYRVNVFPQVDTTYRIAVHTDWGRANQKTVRSTKWAEAGAWQEVTGVDFEFRPEAK